MTRKQPLAKPPLAPLLLGLVSSALLGGCPKTKDGKPVEPAAKRDAGARPPIADDAPAIVLPPPPPLPELPAGLPTPTGIAATPAAVALGELLFSDPRLSQTGKLSCASCHVPAEGYAGSARQDTAAGKPNLRRAPALVNLAWVQALGWDGRYASLPEQLTAHIRGQLGEDLAASTARLGELLVYRAHFARVGGAPAEAALGALVAFVATRYDGGSPWDRLERDPAVPAPIKAGYQLFSGKAQCSVCHAPPLYTDGAFHRLGLIAVKDEGRGRIDPAQLGAFRTPTLRGAARRKGFFHDASAPTLEAAIAWHLDGGLGQGADPSIVDPALKKVALTPAERAQLAAFVGALTEAAPPPPPPTLP